MRIGVVTFPGSLDDDDTRRAITLCGGTPIDVWHTDTALGDLDGVVLPGGFSHGDYLRSGAIASRAPVIAAISDFAQAGGPVLGICNGFQVLCEAGLLPGALLRNEGLRFVCRTVPLVVASTATPWTRAFAEGEQILIPAKHGEGRYHADSATLDQIESNGQVVVRYAPGHNPNGSARDIAGVANERGNVVGMMPHPEHAVERLLVGGEDGRGFFESLMDAASVR